MMAGMFGALPIDYGVNMGAQSPLMQAANVQPLPQMAPQSGGMFGAGGVGRGIAGMIGDFLMQRAGMQPMYGPMMMERQKLAVDQEAQFRNWKRQYDYELANPKATEPHYFQDNSGNEMAIGADGKPVTVYEDPNPWKLVPNGMGGVIPVNMKALMSGGAQGMPAVGAVVDDPRAGGGATGSAPSPTFRPYYP